MVGIRLQIDLRIYITAVSYTHLDVYKRQGLNVATVNVSNIKNPGASIVITNCTNITSFSVDNS